MKDFYIGQPVACSAYTTMEYDEKDRRLPIDHPCELFKGVIVGRKMQQLGIYHRGGISGGFDGEEYDPPYLSITGTVEFWEVRTGWRNKPLFVRDEHLTSCHGFAVPMQSARPTLKPTPAAVAA